MRWQKGEYYDKRAAKQLRVEDVERAERWLEKLTETPPPGDLKLKPMEGHNRVLCEARAGGQNRFILRLTRDGVGPLFIVEDVGPHDIYKKHRP
ncbi:MAG: hypothetical protein GC191_05330 [Azospirillum sp.]|nr:hypothetical protein [Azospirillum sp.]